MSVFWGWFFGAGVHRRIPSSGIHIFLMVGGFGARLAKLAGAQSFIERAPLGNVARTARSSRYPPTKAMFVREHVDQDKGQTPFGFQGWKWRHDFVVARPMEAMFDIVPFWLFPQMNGAQ